MAGLRVSVIYPATLFNSLISTRDSFSISCNFLRGESYLKIKSGEVPLPCAGAHQPSAGPSSCILCRHPGSSDGLSPCWPLLCKSLQAQGSTGLPSCTQVWDPSESSELELPQICLLCSSSSIDEEVVLCCLTSYSGKSIMLYIPCGPSVGPIGKENITALTPPWLQAESGSRILPLF